MSSATTTGLAFGFAFDGDWKSEIKTAAGTKVEGTFSALTENAATGLVSGSFVPETVSPQPIGIVGGKHTPPAGGATSHRVTVIRDDDTDVYVYIGIITDQGGGIFKADGRRLKITKPIGLSLPTAEALVDPLPVSDDEWIGTRPPT